MVTEKPDRRVNTDKKVQNNGVKRMPHERDESPDDQNAQPRGIMKQAADDIGQGLVDTDLHGTPGVEQAVQQSGAPGQARPQPDAAEGMRNQTPATQQKEQKGAKQ
ncbi:MAG: hypothetical protein JWR56_1657 [Massilia sp.]|nr:hypothetical protein [Massilia sp.]